MLSEILSKEKEGGWLVEQQDRISKMSARTLGVNIRNSQRWHKISGYFDGAVILLASGDAFHTSVSAFDPAVVMVDLGMIIFAGLMIERRHIKHQSRIQLLSHALRRKEPDQGTAPIELLS